MDITIYPGRLSGRVRAPASKSLAHRYLICAAFSDGQTTLFCPETSQDIEATVDCLNRLGAEIKRTENGYLVTPIRNVPAQAVLNCRESGSTLRFLLPVVGALGIDTVFQMAGLLPRRPLSPLWEEMERMGCDLSRLCENTICCKGKLKAGTYIIDGSVSSQFISGLLFALSLIKGVSSLQITGKTESKPYIEMTKAALNLFHAPDYHTPGQIEVEGDWSNGAFFLAANALGSNLSVANLDPHTLQGDRVAAELLQDLEYNVTIDAADIPDLVPILAVVAAFKKGATFTNIRRLRLKESDRVAAVTQMISQLGGYAESTENTLTVYAKPLTGGCVDSYNDHRIAMAAAIAATVCQEPVTVTGAEAVNKSYPGFWEEYRKLGGNYEQYLR